MAKPRLDRYLAHGMGISRSDAQRLARRGRVTIGGEVARHPSAHVEDDLEVRVDDALVRLPGRVVLMMHKPAGVVSV